MVDWRVGESNIDGFSGKMLAVIVYYLDVGDDGFRVIVGNALYVNCNGDLINTLFHSIFQTSAWFSNEWKVIIFFLAGPFVDYILFLCDDMLSLGCIRMDLRMLAALKMTCTLVCQKISSKFWA